MRLSSENRDRLVLTAIGAVAGLAFWLATTTGEGRALPPAALAFLLTAGTIVQLATTGRDAVRLAASASAVGLAVALPALWVYAQMTGSETPYRGDEARAATFWLAAAVAVYVALPFVQIVQATGRARWSYTDLFRHAWGNLFVLGIGGVLLGLAWALLALWGQLFHLVGVTAFERLFYSRPFADVVTFAAFGFGLALGRESERVVAALRRVTLTVFCAVTPVLAAIALLFLASLPLTGLEPLWSTRSASPVLLSVLIVAIIFLNAVFQDGTAPPPYPTWLRRGIEAMVLTLPVFAGLSLYSVGLRIAQYGLMPERIYTVVFGGVGLAFGGGYGAAVLARHGAWMGLARPVNVALSVAVALLALLLHTPILDPIGMSARSQAERLAEGRVSAAAFDYGALRFRLGRAGHEALDRLAALEGHPEASTIAAEVVRVRQATSEWTWKRGGGQADVARPLGTGASLPDGLAADIRRQSWASWTCEPEPCVVFEANLDDDADPEYVVVPSSASRVREVRLFDRREGGWLHVGTLEVQGPSPGSTASLLDLVEQGLATAAEPVYRDLLVGEFRYHLTGR